MTEYLNFVCPVCLHQPHECRCGTRIESLIRVDLAMQPVVHLLNDKGYYTTQCCESHKANQVMYISFMRDYDFGTLPEGFTMADNTLRQKRASTEEEFEHKKQQYLSDLISWAENLPDEEDNSGRIV